jgi:hypothetical protein
MYRPDVISMGKESLLSTVHKLINEGSEDYLTTLMVNLDMMDVHVALNGVYDWNHSLKVKTHGRILNVSYRPNDNARALCSKVLAMVYDQNVWSHPVSSYRMSSCTPSVVLSVITAILDPNHVV